MVVKLKIPIIILILFSSKSTGNLTSILIKTTENYELIQNCLENIIATDDIRNTLIVTKQEHLLKFDVTFIGKITTMKIYKRKPGWRRFNRMLQFKWMSFLLTFKQCTEIEDYLGEFRRHRYFNSRMRFIIVPILKLAERDLAKCSEILIRYKIINYVILNENSNVKIIELVTNFPYNYPSCGEYSANNDEIVATFENKSGFSFPRKTVKRDDFFHQSAESKLYPSKIPRNLHGCEIHIVTGLWPPNVIDVNREVFPGIEIEFVRMIAKYMNFVPKYLYMSAVVGEKLPNTTWSGFMGHIKRNEVDMAIGAVHVDPNRDFVFDVTFWYLSNFMLWIVPRMRPPPKSAIFDHFVVESSVLAKSLFIFVFFITILIALASTRALYTLDTKHYGKIGYIIVVLIQMFLGQCVYKLPQSFRVRKIFGSWLGFCTFVIFLFQSSITSYFMSPGKAVQLSNIEEAFNLGLRISYDKYYDPFVINASKDFKVPHRNEEHPVIPSLNLVANGKAVTVIDRLRAIYITKQWLREDGSLPIQLLYNKPVRVYWVHAVLTKGHFLSPWVDELVRKAGNNGFWNFKENEYIERRTIQYSVRRQIVLMNDIQGLPNRAAVDRYNDAVYEAFPKAAANEEVNRIFEPTATSEDDLLEMFRVSSDSSISFRHLLPVFELCAFGVFWSLVAFFSELLWWHRQKIKKVCSRNAIEN